MKQKPPLTDAEKTVEETEAAARETIEAAEQGHAPPRKPCDLTFLMVPRDRIELPTRGFSVPCSTN